MSRYGREQNAPRRGVYATLATALAFLWLVPLALYGVLWVVFNFLFEGYAFTKGFNTLSWTFVHSVNVWITVCVWLVISTVIAALFREEGLSTIVVVVTAAAVVAVGVYPVWFTLWDNDKDFGRYYAESTTFNVSNPSNVPDSLRLLAKEAHEDKECALRGTHDVNGCIQRKALSTEGWEPRISSLEGAKNAIRRKTDGVQRVSLSEKTVTYLNATKNAPAAWSGVLDGSGREQPLYGVAEWSGAGDPTVCRFEGEYAIKRAFDGSRGNSLSNFLADQFPKLRWNLNDVWGYCEDDEPVVVVPATAPTTWKHRTVDTAAGVIEIRGRDGAVHMEHFTEVAPNNYRGPVYPASLVAVQREQTKWTAGRKNMDRFGFGYDASDSEVQSGNSAEYLMREKDSGRLVYVTPLTLRSSTSEVFVAYAVTYADEVAGGQLNELEVYVLDREDPRLVNIDQLAADANDWMSRNAGMFRSNGGRLIEFTPIDGDTWRVFGEMGGQVVYQLDISATNKMAPKLVSIGSYTDAQEGVESSSGDGTPLTASSECVADLASLDDTTLASCLSAVTGEVQQRLTAPTP
jgi:hypothetical protein